MNFQLQQLSGIANFLLMFACSFQNISLQDERAAEHALAEPSGVVSEANCSKVVENQLEANTKGNDAYYSFFLVFPRRGFYKKLSVLFDQPQLMFQYIRCIIFCL